MAPLKQTILRPPRGHLVLLLLPERSKVQAGVLEEGELWGEAAASAGVDRQQGQSRGQSAVLELWSHGRDSGLC